MKVVLLTGGKGTRIGEGSQYKPKLMIEISDMLNLYKIFPSLLLIFSEI